VGPYPNESLLQKWGVEKIRMTKFESTTKFENSRTPTESGPPLKFHISDLISNFVIFHFEFLIISVTCAPRRNQIPFLLFNSLQRLVAGNT